MRVWKHVGQRFSLYFEPLGCAKPIITAKSHLYYLGKGIKAILSVARSGLVNHKKVDIPYYLYIPAEDREDYPIYQYFEQTYDFIEKARK